MNLKWPINNNRKFGGSTAVDYSPPNLAMGYFNSLLGIERSQRKALDRSQNFR
jgi:hypothetical protein